MPDSTVSNTPEPAYQVEAPRAGDALVLALRDAYSRDAGLPEDMVAMLRCLNRYEAPAAH